MSVVHAGRISVLSTPAAPLARALARALRRLFHHACPVQEDADPTQMSRERLAEELFAPCPQLSAADIREAAGIGISPPKGTPAEAALTLKLAIARELMCRDLRHRLRDAPIMAQPSLLAEWLKVHCAGLNHEVFFVIYLTVQNRVIAIEPLFRGTLSETHVYPREVVTGALLHRAAAVALAHNHPVGDCLPSGADKSLTRLLANALAQVDVRVLDHLVISGRDHYSFAEHGDL